MILEFSDDMSSLAVYAQGRELASIFGQDKDEEGKRVYSWPDEKKVLIHTFTNPVLVTDNFKISQLDPTLRDSLFSLFQSTKKTTIFQSTRIEFDAKKYLGVWGPSIDTVFLAKALSLIDLSFVKLACEVGAGSGFVAKHLLKNQNIEQVNLMDINAHALECWKDNIDDQRAKFHIGDAKTLLTKNFDLVVCNPPYIPRPQSIDDNPYEGLSLMVYLLEHASDYLTKQGKLILNISNLSLEVLHEVSSEYNLKVKELGRLKVPLKVFNILNNQEWMSYLKQKGLLEQSEQGYNFWQEIIVLEITL